MKKNYILKIVIIFLAAGFLIWFGKSDKGERVRGPALLAVKPFLAIGTQLRLLTLPAVPDEPDNRLRALEFTLREKEDENERLKEALNFSQTAKISLIGARVLHYSREAGRELLLINAGKEQGVLAGQLVIDSDKLVVGRVHSAEDNAAIVDIASNPGNTFEVRIIPFSITVLAEGMGGRTLLLRLIPQDALIRRGDFTALLNGQFLLGEIARVEVNTASAFRQARAILQARPERLEEIFIIPSPIKP